MTDEPLDETMLLELQRQTAQLPREIAPPADAWNRIAAEISRDARPQARQPIWQRPAFLIAAAMLLVAATSLSTALVMERRAGPRRSAVAAASQSRSNPSSSSRGPTSLAEFTAIENDYIATVNRLSASIESDNSDLSPETIAKLRESVRIIDAAILEARRALAQDPSNKALIEMLATSYDQKVDLLRRTAEMGSL
jgi:hypothetical protein